MGVTLDAVRRLVRPAATTNVAAAPVADLGADAARTAARSPLRRGPLAIGIIGAGLLTAGCATATRSSPIQDAADAAAEDLRRQAAEHQADIEVAAEPVPNMRELLANGRFWALGEHLVGMQIPTETGWYQVQELAGDPGGYWDVAEANAAAATALQSSVGTAEGLTSRWFVVDNPIRHRNFVVRVQHVQALGIEPDPSNVPMGVRILGDHSRY